MFRGVRTRFPLLLPILRPDYVAAGILGAIQADRRRLVLPRFVLAVLLIRALPLTLFDAVMRFFGVDRSMDEFSGRAETGEGA
jgi:all-trans-retinol dehydrogenase (NAD+)